MRHAVLTDIHGDAARLRAVLGRIQEQGVDQIVCLGDVFDCRIGERRLPGYVFERLEQVFDPDPKLAELLGGVLLLRGNQEERIKSLVPKPRLPDWVPPLLDAPLEYRTDFAVYCHGHLLPWRELEPGVWCPADANFPGRALVHGHHHRSALYQLLPMEKGTSRVRRVPVRFGEPVPLAADGRYVANIGSVTRCAPSRGPSPAWAVLDDSAGTVTYHHGEPWRHPELP